MMEILRHLCSLHSIDKQELVEQSKAKAKELGEDLKILMDVLL